MTDEQGLFQLEGFTGEVYWIEARGSKQGTEEGEVHSPTKRIPLNENLKNINLVLSERGFTAVAEGRRVYLSNNPGVIARLLKPGGRLHIFEGHPPTGYGSPHTFSLSMAKVANMFSDPLVTKLADFVSSIGINAYPCAIDWKTRFPGLEIRSGDVLVDESQLIHPGNILHEAGHIAVHDPARRPNPKFSPARGEELSALAWSYAAVVHLGLSAGVVFYPGSYQGWDTALIENFSEGRYIGVPLMQRYGMTVEPRHASALGVEPFPHMLRWIR